MTRKRTKIFDGIVVTDYAYVIRELPNNLKRLFETSFKDLEDAHLCHAGSRYLNIKVSS